VWFGGGDFSVPVAFFRFLRLSRILKFSKSRAHFFPDRYPTGEGALFALAKKPVRLITIARLPRSAEKWSRAVPKRDACT
jgi:hypothetical protein